MITSTANARVKELRKLSRSRERQARGMTLLEGPHLIAAAVQGRADIREIWIEEGDRFGADLAARAGIDPTETTTAVLNAIATTEAPRGPVAVMAIPPFGPLSVADTVVLWNIADPGNAGTLVRSAAAFGWQVAVGPGSVDVWAPKVLRAGAGAHFVVTLSRVSDLDDLRRAGLTTVASTPRDGEAPAPLDEAPAALLIGSEARGLPDEILAAADRRVTIETDAAVESLNAAVAGSILMWQMSVSG